MISPIAFLVWITVFLTLFPALRLDLHLTDQWISVQFYISSLLLVLSWAFSGPMAAAVLSGLSALAALYIGLSTREPAIFLQLLSYGVLFVSVVFFLQKVQNTANDKQIVKEKLLEDIHETGEAILKKRSLKEALEEKMSRFLDLHRFSEELKGVYTVEAAGKKIAQEVSEVLRQADQSVLYLVDSAQQELALAASVRPSGTAVREKSGTLFDRWVMKKSQGLMVEDAQTDFRFPHDEDSGESRIRSFCASPLVTEKKVLGVVRVSSSRPGAFSADDLRLLDIFSSLGAVTLRNILLYEKMEELAIRDSLTGLYLNRYFQERLTEEIRRAALTRSFFSVILLDIDHFKRYNDEYGHAAGDIVLKSITAAISKSLSPSDMAARYGGEEFTVLLPNKGRKEALEAAEKIREAVEKNKFFLRRVEGRVTASLGVAVFPEEGGTKEELLQAADRWLYEAKHQGRNRVCGKP